MAARGITSTPLPPPPDGYHVDGYQVGVDGRLFGLFSTFDTAGARRRWRKAIDVDESVSLESVPPGSDGFVALAVGAGWRSLASFPFQAYGHAFDVAPDGVCIVARRQCDAGEANASVFSDGAKVAEFHVGSAINHLQCDDRGGIWTGYTDEAWGETFVGIVRFARNGEVSSRYAGDMVDCYALNVGRDATWSCWHSNFPLVRLDDNCSEERWSNDLAAGVSAVAVSGSHALLVGGYDDRNRLTLARMHLGQLRLLRAFDARETLGVDLSKAWFTGRNDSLHVVDEDRWHAVPVGHFVAMAS